MATDTGLPVKSQIQDSLLVVNKKVEWSQLVLHQRFFKRLYSVLNSSKRIDNFLRDGLIFNLRVQALGLLIG